jgi:hypothetical protein
MQSRLNKNCKQLPMLQTEPHIEAPNHEPVDRLHNQDQDHMQQDHQEEECLEQHRINTANTQCNVPNCDSCSRSSGPIVMPTCFLTKHAPGMSGEQQDLMAQAIKAMGMAAGTLAEDTPFTGASVVEEVLQNSSGMRVPIKCFGCDGSPKSAENAFHLWRNCPNKADKIVWENFQKHLKEFRERKQLRQEQKRSQGGGAQCGGGSQCGHCGPPTMTREGANWKRQRFPSKKVQDETQAIADDQNSPCARMPLLGSPKDSLESHDLETEQKKAQPAAKRVKWQGGSNQRTF